MFNLKKSSLPCLLGGVYLVSPLGYAQKMDTIEKEIICQGLNPIECEEFYQELEPIEKDFLLCLGKEASPSKEGECCAKAEKQWDAELDSIYKALSFQLDAKGKSDLKLSQELWVKYRKADFQLIRALPR